MSAKTLNWTHVRSHHRHEAGPCKDMPNGEYRRKWVISDLRRYGMKHRPEDGYRLTLFGAHVRFSKVVKELKATAQEMENAAVATPAEGKAAL